MTGSHRKFVGMAGSFYRIEVRNSRPCVVRVFDGFVVKECRDHKEADEKVKSLEHRRWMRCVRRQTR